MTRQEEMDALLKNERELKADGLLLDEIMGDYSTDVYGKRKNIMSFCGDCVHFKSERDKPRDAYKIAGQCGHFNEPASGETLIRCPHFKLRVHAKKKKRRR